MQFSYSSPQQNDATNNNSGGEEDDDDDIEPLIKTTTTTTAAANHQFEDNYFLSSDLSSSLIYPCSPLLLEGRLCSTEEEILSLDIANDLRQYLPLAKNKHCSSWSLVYHSSQHGFSLNTLYFQSKNIGPCLIVIVDDNGQKFGAYISESLQPHIGYFGNGDCFLWKLDSDHNHIIVYPATGKNQYFLIAELSFIAVGCGNGYFGIWLDSQLLNGVSNSVPTFDNSILASKSNFICTGIEIWKFNSI